jgi:nuclear pore complex protein Nup155
MGLLPSIQRAWITIDHRLFLWNYQDGSDLYLFDEQDQIILSVGLVKPLPGVFVSSVDQVLVVATPLEVFLLGVAFSNRSPVESEKVASAIILYQTQMSTPADGVNMVSIVGTRTGRIFMVGNDGHVYELAYQVPYLFE